MREGETWEALKGWDEKAWRAAYPRLLSAARAGVHSSLGVEDRDEVAAEVVVIVLDYLDRVESLNELTALAAGVARRLSIRRIRHQIAARRGGRSGEEF